MEGGKRQEIKEKIEKIILSVEAEMTLTSKLYM